MRTYTLFLQSFISFTLSTSLSWRFLLWGLRTVSLLLFSSSLFRLWTRLFIIITGLSLFANWSFLFCRFFSWLLKIFSFIQQIFFFTIIFFLLLTGLIYNNIIIFFFSPLLLLLIFLLFFGGLFIFSTLIRLLSLFHSLFCDNAFGFFIFFSILIIHIMKLLSLILKDLLLRLRKFIPLSWHHLKKVSLKNFLEKIVKYFKFFKKAKNDKL